MTVTRLFALAGGAALAFSLTACGDDGGGGDSTPTDTGTDAIDGGADSGADVGTDAAIEVPPAPEGGTKVRIAFDATAEDGRFFDAPWPSDARMTNDGHVDFTGYPNPTASPLIDGVLGLAQRRKAHGQQPVAYFRFDGAIAAGDIDEVLGMDAQSPVLLVDIDPESDERGRLIPVVATVLPEDDYTPENLLGIGPRPGFVLRPATTYAFVVQRSWGDADGGDLGVPAAMWTLVHGGTPDGALADHAPLFAPLRETLDTLGVAPADVAAATVFTTASHAADLFAMSEAIREDWQPRIEDLAVDADDGASHERFCELHGTLTVPDFQRGSAPFNTEGTFEFGDDGLPIAQGEETIPVVVTLPLQPMPADGYPLVLYFHGTGGLAAQVVDRGPSPDPPGGAWAKGLGPSHVLAAFGMGTAGSALPVNPERGGTGLGYLNFNNFQPFADLFRQGAIEQRLYLDALLALEIDPSLVADCAGLSLPDGADAYRFDPEPVLAMGQSMGAMYANMIGSIEPRIEAVAPTGAGGYWSWFLLETTLIDNIPTLVGGLLGTRAELTFMHPGLHLVQLGWEPAEPYVYLPHLGADPLPGHPARDIYQPAGQGDSYFPPQSFDAIALAYNHPIVGDVVWDSMLDVLALDGLDDVLAYPVTDNRTSRDGRAYTSVVTQWDGDGRIDPHEVFQYYDEVKHQYGCFFASYLANGTATVEAPNAIDTPCPSVD